MKRKFCVLATLLTLLALLLSVPGALAQGPDPPRAAESPPGCPPQPENGPCRAPDGTWYRPADTAPPAGPANPLAPLDTGGPDDFGYTWNDAVSLNWIDASSGFDTGMSGGSRDQATGPISLPFSFKYYENSYTQVYIAAGGYLAFTEADYWDHQDRIPAYTEPNNVVAPYWTPTYIGSGGWVRYLSGGTAPNRYFVAEWHNVKGGPPDDSVGSDETYLFETILYENGDIVFQYQTMTYNGSRYCGAAGIEDSQGLDGLSYVDFCGLAPSNKAVRFYRPAPSARVSLSPKGAGAFGAPGAAVQFQQVIRNNGELGTDTYDLFSTSSWPMTFYQPDGATPLTDTDGDGTVDTGPIAQGSSKIIVARVDVPGTATMGQSNGGQLTVRSSVDTGKSKTAPLQVAVPAPFAQSYTQDYHPYAGFYRSTGQITRQTTTGYGYEPTVATTPDGNIAQVWYQSHTNSNDTYVDELYYAVLDNWGNVVRSATRITDNDAATMGTYDYSPGVAVAPDGNVAVVWYRYAWNSSNRTSNYNIYYLILNSAGGTVVPPTNLTNNTQWGSSNVPRFYDPTIAATTGNRFAIAWHRELYDGSDWFDTIWYTVRDSSGSQVKPLTQFSSDTCSYDPNLTPLADGGVFLAQSACGRISIGRLDSAGNILMLAGLSSAYGYGPDAVQLPNGNIVLAWSDWDEPIYYAVLNSSLGTVKGVTSLDSVSLVGDEDVSVTHAGSQAVLTWGDSDWSYSPNLYYALLDGNGDLVTPPMIFASDNTNYRLRLPYNGQGNTCLSYDTTPPTNPTTLTSTSHVTGTWSTDNTVDVAWSGATDADSGVDGYSVLWDNAPATVPDTIKDLEENVQSATSDPLADGDWYFHVRTVDNAGNWASGAAHIGPFPIDRTAPESSARAPEYALGPFPVAWSGSDVTSGITGYDVEVRDGAGGTWTTWLDDTSAVSATYTTGVTGHTYYFRSVAHDAAGNVETDLPADGDAHTTIAAYTVEGQVTNNRHQPVFNATVTAQPAALNAATTDVAGNYALYLDSGGTYTLTASRSGFGALPPRYGIAVDSNLTGVDFVLPPEDEAVANGGWESGDLSDWNSGPSVTPTVEITAAHTGHYGASLYASGGTLRFWPYITQTVPVPVTWLQPTLSMMYRVVQGSPGDELMATVSGAGEVVTHHVPLTPGEWTHTWRDLSAFSGQTVTLRFGFKEQTGAQQIYLDEISLGEARPGVFPIYLPLVTRNA